MKTKHSLPQFTFFWENINVDITEKQSSFCKSVQVKRNVLHNVSGIVNNNSLTAILGSSGAGKTTLLQAISGRLKEKTGTLKINNQVIEDEKIKSISGYLRQSDVFTENLTVEEHSKFMTGMLLNSASKSKLEQAKIMKNLISQLSLESQKNTIIKRLSGGEKRRLSLSTELLNNPYILFCDEPTTGLDSYHAISIVKLLQKLAASGKMVILTIHQPSSYLFNYFDNILLISNGRAIFQGSREDAEVFFQRINLPCPINYNPAEHYLKCITPKEENNFEDIEKIRQLFLKESKKNSNPGEYEHLNGILKANLRVKKGFCYQLKWLVWRSCIDTGRNLNHHVAGYLLLIITALIISLSFAFVKLEEKNSVQNIQGVLLLMVSELAFTNMYAVIYILPSELVIFLREREIYSQLPYFIAKLLALAPIALVNAFTYLTIFYTLLGFLKGFSKYFWMLYTLFCTCFTSSVLGLSFSASFASVEYVELLLSPLDFLIMVMSGIFINLNSLSIFFSWIKYLSPFYYCYHSVSYIYWRDISTIGVNCTENLPCFKDGNEVLEKYAFEHSKDVLIYNIVSLHLLTIFFCLLGYLGISRRNKN